MINKEFTGNQSVLDNPAMDSGRQNDILHKKDIPAFNNEAELVSGNSLNSSELQKQLNLQAITQQNKLDSELNQPSQQVMSKQDVWDLLTLQNRPNLAGRLAAMSSHVDASDMTDENKKSAQHKLNQATLNYAERNSDKDIEPININVHQQQTRRNDFEFG